MAMMMTWLSVSLALPFVSPGLLLEWVMLRPLWLARFPRRLGGRRRFRVL
jgi:hypothetical protein